jgi:hypothetical protein
MVGTEPKALPTPPAGSPPAEPPPRKRRYPQTNPGRQRASQRGFGAQRAGDGTAAATSFGARFVTARSLDQVILEVLAQLSRR